MLSASTNKLSNLKQHAAEYAALIMEELDPDNHGHIEVRMVPQNSSSPFSSLLSHSVFQTDVATRNSIKRNGGWLWRRPQVQQESPNAIKNHDPEKIQDSS